MSKLEEIMAYWDHLETEVREMTNEDLFEGYKSRKTNPLSVPTDWMWCDAALFELRHRGYVVTKAYTLEKHEGGTMEFTEDDG